MAWVLSLWLLAGVAAFSNAQVNPRAVAHNVALLLGFEHDRASLVLLRQKVSTGGCVHTRSSIVVKAVTQCSILAASAATSGRAARLIAQARGGKAGRMQLLQKLRSARNSGEITQLLERITPQSAKEYCMGISAYGRARLEACVISAC